ncbi:MAG: hypothetical protein WC346_05725 [Methanogenium sp.]|jgi:hypothetical protein
MALKKTKLPKDFQLNDPFFIIEQSSVDDHKGILSVNPVNHTFITTDVVKKVEFAERDESLVLITGKRNENPYTAPANGKNSKASVGEVITDEDVAFETAIDLAKKELTVATKVWEEAGKVVECIEKNIKALKERSPENTKAKTFESFLKKEVSDEEVSNIED